MQRFDWRVFDEVDFVKLNNCKSQCHIALQSVAAIGRKFLQSLESDENATLSWIPGLTRLSGKWVEGSSTFRVSLSFEAFRIYLVDEKVNTISVFDLNGQNQNQLLVWLEEQVGKLQLGAGNLTLNLPYIIPDYGMTNADAFSADTAVTSELAKYFHNSFISIRDVVNNKGFSDFEIKTWPHHFDQACSITIKDTGDIETNSTVSFGMSPGDEEFAQPYFYVNSWPHIETSKFGVLNNGAVWHEGSWTGAILMAENVINAKDQKAVLDSFYESVSSKIIQQLES